MGLQDNFSGAGGRAEGSHIIKMMELVGKKDRLKKIRFPQSKKEKSERRYYNAWQNGIVYLISKSQKDRTNPNLPLTQSLQELNSVKMKGSVLYIVGGNSMSPEVVIG